MQLDKTVRNDLMVNGVAFAYEDDAGDFPIRVRAFSGPESFRNTGHCWITVLLHCCTGSKVSLTSIYRFLVYWMTLTVSQAVRQGCSNLTSEPHMSDRRDLAVISVHVLNI
jgi:hypothetical protein